MANQSSHGGVQSPVHSSHGGVINSLMLKNYDNSPLHYHLMHAMVQPALETECVSESGVRRICPSPQVFEYLRMSHQASLE